MPARYLGALLGLAALAASSLAAVTSTAIPGKASASPNKAAAFNRTEAPGKEASAPDGAYKSPFDNLMIQRALYVLIGVTAVVVIYFIIRTIRRNKRYGVLSTSAEHIELAALEQEDDDDDEDTTLFEARQGRR
ncbi:unnamed protein product [Lampetra planeri]